MQSNRVMTDAEYADLWEEGKAPADPMIIVRHVWDCLTADEQALILGSQPVVVFDRPYLDHPKEKGRRTRPS